MKTLIALALLVVFPGCASYHLVAVEKQAWVTKRAGGYGGPEVLYYCVSGHETAGAVPKPVCYEPTEVESPAAIVAAAAAAPAPQPTARAKAAHSPAAPAKPPTEFGGYGR
jgi:hypothetical protein